MTAETVYLNDDHGYFEAARAETARVLALYGDSPRQTVIRVDDGDAGEPSDWLQREEAENQRQEIEESQ